MDITYRVAFWTTLVSLSTLQKEGLVMEWLAILITLGLGTMSQLPIVPLWRFPDLHVNSCSPAQELSGM